MLKRVILLMLFPVLVLLMIVGWCLFWLGSASNDSRPTHPATTHETDTTCHFQILADPPETT